MSEHIVTRKTYLLIFGALLALTALTIRVALIDLGPFNVVAALVIALCKASLVVLFFMHVRYGSRLIALAIFCGLLWLALLIGLTMTDFLSRNWIAAPPRF
jgi:cytochrome c oxidase subunit 4